ncbi:MAG: cytochrome c-type biogenesis protein CcmH [Rhodospirillales bacterium]|nr:cytochrome c-type biogenesis protein CcmH [Rhodospirillales bacterium]
MRPLLCLLLVLAMPALALDDRERLDDHERLGDPLLEDRARALFREVRCVVCQNQSIDDSEAQIAKDLRGIIREQLAEGRNEEQILGFLTARYGDYVRLEPPFRSGTLLLWLAPAIALLGGGALVWSVLRGRTEKQIPSPLSREEQARLDRLMKRDSP